MATPEEVNSISVQGFVGPIGLDIKVVIDNEVMNMYNFVTGANKEDYHYINLISPIKSYLKSLILALI